MGSIKHALHDLLNNRDLPLSEAISRHFTGDYRQRTNGEWSDLSGFTAHIAHLRGIVRAADIDVVNELTQGRQYADRHIVGIDKNDGSRVVHEVYLFGELDDDGRFRRIEETTLMLAGDEADRSLGNAR